MRIIRYSFPSDYFNMFNKSLKMISYPVLFVLFPAFFFFFLAWLYVLLLFSRPIVSVYCLLHFAVIVYPSCYDIISLFISAACHCQWLQEHDEVSPRNAGDRSSDGGGTMAT